MPAVSPANAAESPATSARAAGSAASNCRIRSTWPSKSWAASRSPLTASGEPVRKPPPGASHPWPAGWKTTSARRDETGVGAPSAATARSPSAENSSTAARPVSTALPDGAAIVMTPATGYTDVKSSRPARFTACTPPCE